jgi:hypothetical protein
MKSRIVPPKDAREIATQGSNIVATLAAPNTPTAAKSDIS